MRNMDEMLEVYNWTPGKEEQNDRILTEKSTGKKVWMSGYLRKHICESVGFLWDILQMNDTRFVTKELAPAYSRYLTKQHEILQEIFKDTDQDVINDLIGIGPGNRCEWKRIK